MLRARILLWIVLIVLLFLPGRHAVPATVTIKDVIANVRANELLYDDCEAVLRVEYSLIRNPATFPDDSMHEVTHSSSTAKYVLQKGMFRLSLDQESRNTGSADASQTTRFRVFDGNVSQVKENNIVNIVDGRRLDEHIIRPHMMIVQSATYAVPLSTYLEGRAAVIAVAGPKAIGEDTNILVEYAGEDIVDGRRCHKLDCRNVDVPSGTITLRLQMWLAPDRNWIPVRLHEYKPRWSNSKPICEASVMTFRQVAPGVWCPSEARVKFFDHTLLQKTGEQLVTWERSYFMEQFSLNPNYPLSFFQEFEIPTGAVVFNVNSAGEITAGRIEGTPDAGHPRPVWRNWAILLNGLVVCVLLAIYFYYLRRRKAHLH